MQYTGRWVYGLVVRYAALSCCAIALLLPPPCGAQIAGTGTIQGTVADSMGAVVPQASVTLTDEATHVTRRTTTDNAGVYVFPSVAVSTYDIAVSAPGFKTYEQKRIVLEVGSSIAINASLSIGTAEMKVEVQSEGLALQTEDPTFKQTIDQQAVTEMPLNGRQMTSLITLSGGSSAAPAGDFTGSKYSYQTISVSIAGGGGNTTLWRLDGGDNQDYMGNGNLPYPFPDAVSEFSVESTDLGAQDGGHVGGLVNVVTRSGTNEYHGEAFEFIRNNFIDATNFFSTCTPVAPATTCSAKDTLHQNQFGGTFGGAIKRDKMFAFAAYQRTKADQTQASTQATVPTAANLNGDWSTTDGVPGPLGTPAASQPLDNNCASNSKAIQLYDPLTGTPLIGNKYATTPSYNAAALALEKYLPAINSAYDTKNCGFVSYAIPYALTDNQFVSRVDYTVGPNQNLYGRYFIDGYQFPAYYSPTNILITTQSGNIERVQTFTLGDAYTFSSKFVNAAHISVLRRVNNRGYNASDINASNLGISTSSLYQMAPNGLQISEGKFTIGGGTNSVAHFNDNTVSFDDDVAWMHGKHQIAFGGEWVQNELNIGNVYEGNGIFTFNGEYSGSGPNPTGAIGDQNLDFLIGTLGASGTAVPFQQSKQQQNALRGAIPSLYIQDTYHATSKLTLVGGLRYGPNFMPVDYFNRGIEFNMADFMSNTVSSVYPNAPAGILYYGDKGVSREFTKNSPWQFSPNIGLSFDPAGTGKTVLRAGTALMYDNPNFFTAQRNQQNPPFATAISNTQSSGSGPVIFSAPWSSGSITANPFPQPIVPTPAQATFYPQSQYIVMPAQFHPAYTIQWTLSVQHQFAGGWQLQLDYIGNGTRHDPLGYTFNPAVFIPGNWETNGTGCAGIVTTGAAAVKTTTAGTPCSTTKNQNSRFALSIASPAQGNQIEGGGAGSNIVAGSATANYDGLVTSLQHRLSSTFNLLSNWTWSKCLNIADALGDYAGTNVENPNNPKLDYGPCGSDYRHIENISLVAKSAFHSRFNRTEQLIANDWEIAPLIHIQSGAPVNVTTGADDSLTDIGNDRPNLVPGVVPYLHTKIKSPTGESNRGYLNPAAFAPVCANNVTANCATAGTYGNVSRNAFRTPSFFQFDSQISRIFPIRERYNVTVRLEAFNVLNHPNFAFSSATQALTSTTFGQLSTTPSSTSTDPPNSAFSARVFQGSLKFAF